MITIDLQNIIDNTTPPRLRSVQWNETINALQSFQKKLLNELYQIEAKKKYEMAFTGQVIYLEKLLNDKFNNSGTEIYITDRVISSRFYLHNKNEAKPPVYLYNQSEGEDPLYLFNDVEYQHGFIIHVPSGLVTNWNEFKWWVDKYKLKSKEYTIIEY